MEIFDYFDQADFSLFSGKREAMWKSSLGCAIEKSTIQLTHSNPDNLDVVIFGVPVDNGSRDTGAALAPGEIRNELYRLSAPPGKCKMADLGDLKPAVNLKGTLLALRDVMEFFSECQITMVVIGGSQDLTAGICEAFKNHKYFCLSAVDAFLDMKTGVESFHSSNYLTRVFRRIPHLFQFNLIGYQSPFVSEAYLSGTAGVNDHLRLGQLRDKMHYAEPVMRNTDVLSFDMGAVKYSDAPSGRIRHPNGLRSEEACQLARYAGLSDRMKVFGLFELVPGGDQTMLSAKLAAEIIWYFLEGYIMRKKNFQSEDNRVVYKVAVKDLDQPIVFLRDEITNRWWYEISSISGETATIACLEEEYREAAANEIPARWLKFVQKMDRLLK